MAHFLEHLVFKGGQKYDDYRKVNETAERMGAVLNAYTSHDLVAFHITCRAEVAGDAIDLLTDFVGRPKIDAEELDRERGVVIQEIARANDQPSVGGRAPDRPRGVRRPPARAPGAGPGGAPAHVHARGDRGLPLAPVGGLPRRRVPGRQPRRTCPTTRELAEAFGRFPSISPDGGTEPAPVVRAADAGRGTRVQPVAPADLLPPVDRPARSGAARRARRLLDAARRLDGLAAVRRDPRAARPRLLRLLGRPLVRRRPDPAAVGGPGVRQVRRGLHAHARDRRRAAHRRPARGRVRARPARTPPGGACWRSRTPTRWRATRPRSPSCSGRTSTRTRRSRRSTAPPSTRSRRSPAASPRTRSVACVGPHETGEFTVIAAASPASRLLL